MKKPKKKPERKHFRLAIKHRGATSLIFAYYKTPGQLIDTELIWVGPTTAVGEKLARYQALIDKRPRDLMKAS
jgi:hypothetical protein